MESLDRLIGVYAARGESLVVEGVHLSLNVVLRQLMPRHPGVLPFLIHISNEAKHRERFAVRAKYMTLDPKSAHCFVWSAQRALRAVSTPLFGGHGSAHVFQRRFWANGKCIEGLKRACDHAEAPMQ